MLVLMEEAAQAVASTDVEVRDRVWVGDRLGQWFRWSGVRDSSMGSVSVVVPLVLV
jgi:hypothetical protein